VTVARDGQQAVDILRSLHRERVDLVLTDYLMPKVCALAYTDHEDVITYVQSDCQMSPSSITDDPFRMLVAGRWSWGAC